MMKRRVIRVRMICILVWVIRKAKKEVKEVIHFISLTNYIDKIDKKQFKKVVYNKVKVNKKKIFIKTKLIDKANMNIDNTKNLTKSKGI